jgi:dTDP-glucose 4,6-dehydratase
MSKISSDKERVALVAGGAGFIGSHLCQFLLDKGCRVICVDNFITGRKKNVEPLLDCPDFSLIEQDITRKILPPLKQKIDFIYHLASLASPKDYLEHPLETLKVGSLGTLNLLELACEQGARFLYTSTSEVYGDPLVHPQPETYWGNVNPVGVRSVYDESKRYAESLVMAYHRKFGLDTRICRIFNTFGEHMKHDDGRALPNFITQALKNEPLTVYGDGTQTRSLCYIADMLEGIYRLMRSEITGPVNLGNPQEITMIDLAKEVIELAGSKSKITFYPLPQDDPKVRCPDISKAKKELGWEPKIDRKEGIKKTIRYFKDELRL